MKSDIRLLALDLDNTLLNSEKKISEANQHILKQCEREGIRVVTASGRFFHSQLSFTDQLSTKIQNNWHVCNGGAGIYAGHELIWREHGFKADVFEALLKQIRKTSLFYFVDTVSKVYYDHTLTAMPSQRAQQVMRNPYVYRTTCIDNIKAPVRIIFYCRNEKEVAAAHQIQTKGAVAYDGGDKIVEIAPDGFAVRGEDARFGVLRGLAGTGKLSGLGAFGGLVAGIGGELQDGDALSGGIVFKHDVAAVVADVLRLSGEIEEGVAASARDPARAGGVAAVFALTLTLTRLTLALSRLALALSRLYLTGGPGKLGCARRVFLQPFLERFGAVRVIVRGREAGIAVAGTLLALTLLLTLTLLLALTLLLTLTGQLPPLVVAHLRELFEAFAQSLRVSGERVGERLKLFLRHGRSEVVPALFQELRQRRVVRGELFDELTELFHRLGAAGHVGREIRERGGRLGELLEIVDGVFQRTRRAGGERIGQVAERFDALERLRRGRARAVFLEVFQLLLRGLDFLLRDQRFVLEDLELLFQLFHFLMHVERAGAGEPRAVGVDEERPGEEERRGQKRGHAGGGKLHAQFGRRRDRDVRRPRGTVRFERGRQESAAVRVRVEPDHELVFRRREADRPDQRRDQRGGQEQDGGEDHGVAGPFREHQPPGEHDAAREEERHGAERRGFPQEQAVPDAAVQGIDGRVQRAGRRRER